MILPAAFLYLLWLYGYFAGITERSDLMPFLSEEHRKRLVIIGERDMVRYDRRLIEQTFFLLGLLPGILLLQPQIFAYAAMLPVLYLLHRIRSEKRRAKEIQREITRQIPHMLLQITLALHAGSRVDQAWKEISGKNEGRLYEAMREVNARREMGISPTFAYLEFGKRYRMSDLSEIGRMFASALTLGSAEFQNTLSLLRKEVLEKEKRIMEMEADEAMQKMLLPGLLTFLGILLLLFVPALSGTL